MWGDVEQAFREGAHRVALAVAGFLPGVVTMLLVFAFAVAIAHLVRFAVKRSLLSIDFDRWVHRWGFAATGDWTPGQTPTHLAAQSSFWFVILVGFLAGLKALGTAVTDVLAERTLAYIPNLLAAVVIFAVGVTVARFLQRTTLINAVNMQIHSARLISLGVKWLVILFSVALALHELNIGGAVLTISFALVFGGIVLAVALAVGLGAREPPASGRDVRWRDEHAAAEAPDDIRHM